MAVPSLAPPPRFAGATFDQYRPETPSQEAALVEARRFAEAVRRRYARPHWHGLLRRLRRQLHPHADDAVGAGLYLVGPVGTGKTHLLASIYHALHPGVPCAFVHSSGLFRATERPEDYARALAARARLLLIDEVELDDPAAEVRLINVLKALRRLGVTVAATSNAEPERFVSAQFGRDRLERFISEEFRRLYHVVFVGGEDFRRRMEKPGRAFVGPPEAASAALGAAFDAAPEPKALFSFRDLLRKATETERTALARELAALDRLFVEDVAVEDSDDALRLLRIVDDLYAEPDPPALFFSARTPPSDWFRPEEQAGGLARGVAEKFARTASRLGALAAVEFVGLP